MEIATTLHTHVANGSPDSRTPAAEMVAAARTAGIQGVGFVGHDRVVSVNAPGSITFAGIEHTLNTERDLHMVEFPKFNFRFLSHPAKSFAPPVKPKAMAVIEALDLDGVEKWNAGARQYTGHLPVVELANDDAHWPPGVGLSFMRVRVPNRSPSAIMAAIKRGEFTTVNRALSLVRAGGGIEKAATLLFTGEG